MQTLLCRPHAESAVLKQLGKMCDGAAVRQARQASRIALITLALYFVTMASQVVTAWNSKRTNERRWHMTVPLLLGAAGLMCAPALQRCLFFCGMH